ncbi:MAG: hypothetical protein LVS60_12105 [Nodosilinea sp. LVE1205-7]
MRTGNLQVPTPSPSSAMASYQPADQPSQQRAYPPFKDIRAPRRLGWPDLLSWPTQRCLLLMFSDLTTLGLAWHLALYLNQFLPHSTAAGVVGLARVPQSLLAAGDGYPGPICRCRALRYQPGNSKLSAGRQTS